MSKLNNDTQQKFICEIIEHFENFLDAKGIELDNPEKQEAIDTGEEEDSIANIYGTDYGWLQSDIEGSLKSWGLIEDDPVENNNGVLFHLTVQEQQIIINEGFDPLVLPGSIEYSLGYCKSEEEVQKAINDVLESYSLDGITTELIGDGYGLNGPWRAYSADVSKYYTELPSDEERKLLFVVTSVE